MSKSEQRTATRKPSGHLRKRVAFSHGATWRELYSPALLRVLSTQRLLSGISAGWTGGSGRPSLGVAGKKALARFVDPPKRGRPSFETLADRGQMKLFI
jgi:hypothetical protein